jgi:hypothetical protein
VIVLIAKGPAYVADAYPLIDSDRPAKPEALDAAAPINPARRKTS